VERLAEEVAGLLPSARVLVATSDTIRGPAAAAALVGDVRDGAVDLLIGTQILAKGHHFPRLTLVGVVDADLGLAGGDLRAAERTWQMLNQVAGRAGRAERPGRVILQSWQPEHPVLQAIAAGDRDGFIAEEKAGRERCGMPPYGRLAAIIVSGRRAEAVQQAAQALGRYAPVQDGLAVLGPTPAPLALLRGYFRHRLLVKAARTVNLQDYIRRWLSRTPQPGGVRIKVDIDPYSFS